MLTILETNNRFGLARGEEVVLPATYDAVWKLIDAFWGVRTGNVFGVRAADGSEICPCELPATYWGFAQLQIDAGLKKALETEASFIDYLYINYVGLQTCSIRDGIFQPAKWWAETVTPHLVNSQGELRLYGTDQCLVLTQSGAWSWLEEVPYPCLSPLLCATHTPLTFSEIVSETRLGVPMRFSDMEIRSLMYWHMELTSDGELTQEDYDNVFLRDSNARDNIGPALEEVLLTNDIAPALKQHVPVAMPALPPEVQMACEKLLFEKMTSRAEVNHLLYLAWLWANDFVHFDAGLHRHTVNAPYDFDLTPLNLGEDHRQTLADIYRENGLGRLFPLLRAAPRALSR